MTIFLLKSVLSLLVLLLGGVSVFSMLTALGRDGNDHPVERLKRRHRLFGYTYFVLVLFISYLCIGFAAASRQEPTPRASLHALIALTIIGLFLLKVLFVRVYRRFYGQARAIGLAMGVMTLVLVGLSAGYFLAVSRFGQDRTMDRSAHYALRGPLLTVVPKGAPGVTEIRTDRRSIERGRELFAARCAACHDPLSDRTIVGPGLQGLLRRTKLPVSGNPATAESIRFQLKQPRGRMPSFAYLSSEEVEDLLAYLNTL